MFSFSLCQTNLFSSTLGCNIAWSVRLGVNSLLIFHFSVITLSPKRFMVCLSASSAADISDSIPLHLVYKVVLIQRNISKLVLKQQTSLNLQSCRPRKLSLCLRLSSRSWRVRSLGAAPTFAVGGYGFVPKTCQ